MALGSEYCNHNHLNTDLPCLNKKLKNPCPGLTSLMNVDHIHTLYGDDTEKKQNMGNGFLIKILSQVSS